MILEIAIGVALAPVALFAMLWVATAAIALPLAAIVWVCERCVRS